MADFDDTVDNLLPHEFELQRGTRDERRDVYDDDDGIGFSAYMRFHAHMHAHAFTQDVL